MIETDRLILRPWQDTDAEASGCMGYYVYGESNNEIGD